MNQQNTFSVNQKIHGEMPSQTIWATNPGSQDDKLNSLKETIPFEGIVKQLTNDNKGKTFQLTSPINPETEATQKAREKGDLLVEVGDIISVDDSPGWDIKPMPITK